MKLVRNGGFVGILIAATSCNGGNGKIGLSESDSSVQGIQNFVIGPTRTINGAFRRTYLQDDGTQTAVVLPQPPDTVISALVRDSSPQRYQSFPGTILADGTFSIPNAPVGTYFLSVASGGFTDLTERATDTLDFNERVASRPDLQHVTRRTMVTLDMSNLDPWTPGSFFVGDYFAIYSSQAFVDMRPFQTGGAMEPAPGSTTYLGDIDWNRPSGNGLPDASKGDVVYFHQNPKRDVGTDPATAVYKHATKYARVTDLTLSDRGTCFGRFFSYGRSANRECSRGRALFELRDALI